MDSGLAGRPGQGFWISWEARTRILKLKPQGIKRRVSPPPPKKKRSLLSMKDCFDWGS